MPAPMAMFVRFLRKKVRVCLSMAAVMIGSEGERRERRRDVGVVARFWIESASTPEFELVETTIHTCNCQAWGMSIRGRLARARLVPFGDDVSIFSRHNTTLHSTTQHNTLNNWYEQGSVPVDAKTNTGRARARGPGLDCI